MTDSPAEKTPYQDELQAVLNQSLAEFTGQPITEELKSRVSGRVNALMTIQFQLTTCEPDRR